MSEAKRPSPYRTPTRAVPVELSIEGGRVEEVTLYLSTLAETHAGPETVEDALNRARDFIPVRGRETEQIFLVRRSAIRIVSVADRDDSQRHEESPVYVDLVRVELDGGESIEGTLATILPPDRPRLSDYFNLIEETFVPISVDEGVRYVNKHFVSIVWL